MNQTKPDATERITFTRNSDPEGYYFCARDEDMDGEYVRASKYDLLQSQFTEFLTRAGAEIRDGELVFSAAGYGAFTKRKGDQRTREIYAENQRLLERVSDLEKENSALAKWSCATCGCRFSRFLTPEILMDGVTRCTKCVEVEVLSQQISSLTQRAEAAEKQLANERLISAERLRNYQEEREAADIVRAKVMELVERNQALTAEVDRLKGENEVLSFRLFASAVVVSLDEKQSLNLQGEVDRLKSQLATARQDAINNCKAIVMEDYEELCEGMGCKACEARREFAGKFDNLIGQTEGEVGDMELTHKPNCACAICGARWREES